MSDRREQQLPSQRLEWTIPVGEFDLEHTLESGQCFRWQRLAAREYWGVVEGCAIHVRQEENQLRAHHWGGRVPAEFARFVNRYFDCSTDYSAILRRLRRDKPFAQIGPRRATIHILRQGPFETLISFIISANNHIPRIRSIIERLCRFYGTRIMMPVGEAYSFPSPGALAEARLVDLRAKCGLGYRDVYVRSVARTIAEPTDFSSWHELPTPTLRKRLLELDGVGEKVADCVLLFGFHRLEAFPVDTWIHRAMTELYFPGEEPRLRDVQAMAVRRYGDDAGVAQQYLFAGFRVEAGRARRQ
jgi:N-glycosylase/DNA lyase